jgi:hypothetical protein
MAKVASAFFGGAAIGSQPVVPRFSHDGKSTRGYAFTPVSRSPAGQIVTGDPEPLPFGSEVIVDLGNFMWGPGCYRPYDMSLLVPYGQPIPIVPSGKTGEYTDLLALFLYVRGRGIGQWLISGVLAQNAVYALWTAFGRAGEAAQGLIPVLTLRPSLAIPIASRSGEISYQPVLEITGWTTRDPAVFGPRTVPPPQTRLGSDGAAAAIAAPEPVELPQPMPVILPPEQVAVPVPTPATLPPEQVVVPARATPAPVASQPLAGDALFVTAIPVAAAATAVPGATVPAALPAATVTVAAPSAAPKF